MHGITRQFLADKPLFADVWDGFLEFVEGSELIMHNAAFDIAFINQEMKAHALFAGRDYRLLYSGGQP